MPENLDREYVYISNRLVTEIVDRLKRPRAKEAAIGPRLAQVKVELAQEGLPALARRATEAIRDKTGTLEVPGDYILAHLHLHEQSISILRGWEKENNRKIAAFWSSASVLGIGRILVVLVQCLSISWRLDRGRRGRGGPWPGSRRRWRSR